MTPRTTVRRSSCRARSTATARLAVHCLAPFRRGLRVDRHCRKTLVLCPDVPRTASALWACATTERKACLIGPTGRCRNGTSPIPARSTIPGCSAARYWRDWPLCPEKRSPRRLAARRTTRQKSGATCRLGIIAELLRPSRASGRSDKPVPVRIGDRLGAISNSGLGEEMVDVALHGRLTDYELGRDLRIGKSGSD